MDKKETIRAIKDLKNYYDVKTQNAFGEIEKHRTIIECNQDFTFKLENLMRNIEESEGK